MRFESLESQTIFHMNFIEINLPTLILIQCVFNDGSVHEVLYHLQMMTSSF